MEASELKTIRASLGFTWKRLAAELGVNWRSVAAWERGEHPISGPVAMAIRGLAQQHEQETKDGQEAAIPAKGQPARSHRTR